MLNSFITLLKTPKTQLGIFLTLIFITAFLNNPLAKAILVFLISLASTIISDLLFIRIRNIKPFFPSAALVTGSIIGLLTSPNLALHVPVVIGIIAMFSKNFIRFSNRHVFNPAAFGLLIGSIIFSQSISWWAVSWQQFFQGSGISLRETILFLILLSPALISMFKMRRYRIALSFLLIYTLANKLLNSQFLILNSFLDPTVLFFSIVMLPEPMTSPNTHRRQIIFGIFVPLLTIFLSLILKFSILNSLDPLILSLLLGNVVFFRFR